MMHKSCDPACTSSNSYLSVSYLKLFSPELLEQLSEQIELNQDRASLRFCDRCSFTERLSLAENDAESCTITSQFGINKQGENN